MITNRRLFAEWRKPACLRYRAKRQERFILLFRCILATSLQVVTRKQRRPCDLCWPWRQELERPEGDMRQSILTKLTMPAAWNQIFFTTFATPLPYLEEIASKLLLTELLSKCYMKTTHLKWSLDVVETPTDLPNPVTIEQWMVITKGEYS